MIIQRTLLCRHQGNALLSLGSLLLLVGCGLRPAPPEPLAVTLAPVASARFSDAIDTVSTLEAYELVQLAAQASGRIQQLPISQGDVVKQGQLLLVLDQAQIRAELADLKAQEQKAKLNWQRYEFLVPQGAATAEQRDEFKAQYISAREAVIAKQADHSNRPVRHKQGGAPCRSVQGQGGSMWYLLRRCHSVMNPDRHPGSRLKPLLAYRGPL